MANQTKTKGYTTYKNPIEAIKDFGTSTVKTAAKDVTKIGTGMFDQFFGNTNYEAPSPEAKWGKPEAQKKHAPKKEFNLFNYQQYYEKELIKREIKQLTEIIKQEIQAFKKAHSALVEDVKDIEKLTLESMPENVGIYHVRFMELVISILRTLRAKVGESHTWMQAMISKKKKRGSLFAAISKKKGTQYSMSQELSSSRSVQ